MARIDLRNISVEFPIYNVNARSFKKNFLRLATGGSVLKNANEHIVVRALNDFNLSCKDGDRIGLIGHNGSGKSTLLKLLASIYEPTSGNIKIEGHVSPMLNFSVGIEEEFTGYENIMMHGIMMGRSKREINKQVEEIANLTGLGDYLSMPVRTYSSGMKVRLGFAVSTSINPDILLIDEIFGAGDAEFMKKARQRMVNLLTKSNIVIMASHANSLIKEFCTKGILLENGKVKYYGSVEEAIAIYENN